MLGLVLTGLVRIDHPVKTVGLARHDEMETGFAPLRARSDRIEQAGCGRRLMGDDEDMGGLRHENTSGR
jgi:hypothetical protein